MIRIKAIIPAAADAFLASNRQSRINMAGGLAEVEVINCPNGPASIETSRDVSMTTEPLIAAAQQAEAEGFDAITIDCAADPSLRAVKESVSIPVCAAGEASYMTALLLCNKFSIIAVLDQTVRLIKENIAVYGLKERVLSVVAANVPVLDLESEAAYHAILKQAEIEKSKGAGAIVLGCTGMSKYASILEEQLQIPVIDPAAAAIQISISLALGNRKISKHDF